MQEVAVKPEKYDNSSVKWMLYPSIVFMVFGMSVGLFISYNSFLIPDYFAGEYIHFGRMRPVHVNSVLWLWLISADIGLAYFMVQRLSGVRLWSPTMAKWSAVIWWGALTLSIFSFPFGTNTGWEYAEFSMWVWWIPTKPLITVAWVMVVVNVFMTVFQRKYEKMYVSLWYIMGTMIWATIILIAGWYTIDMIPGGISRVNTNFFYVHNVVGLIFTPFGLATLYYFLPKLANVPVYSHRLSMIGFWSIAFVYGWIGAHHIIHGPMSQWLQTVSIIFSIWLFIPVFTVITNIFATLQTNWSKYVQSPAIRFLIMGNLFYLVTCIQGPLMALRNINEITSKTDWVIGHSHISLYATFSFFAFAGIYYAIPAITKKPLWSEKWARWHFTLNLFGSVPFILSLWIGGFIQGMLWANWATGTSYAQFHSNLSAMTFLQTVAEMYNWWALRSIGGVIILFANILFVINMYNTIMLKPKKKNEVPA